MRPECDRAVVIRRGPAKKVCVLGWDLKTDRFEVGQWLWGRIYERRCDISPDGKYLIYFAMNYGKSETPVGPTWTAISRAPYLKALELIPGFGTWIGGGLFEADGSVWIDGLGAPRTSLKSGLFRVKGAPTTRQAREGTVIDCYRSRLVRDGWEMVAGTRGIAVFRKQAKHGWYISKFDKARRGYDVGKASSYDSHELVREGSEDIPKPDWEWCEFHGGRLLWAEKGKLFAGRFSLLGVEQATELIDLNEMKYERVKAPY